MRATAEIKLTTCSRANGVWNECAGERLYYVKQFYWGRLYSRITLSRETLLHNKSYQVQICWKYGVDSGFLSYNFPQGYRESSYSFKSLEFVKNFEEK